MGVFSASGRGNLCPHRTQLHAQCWFVRVAFERNNGGTSFAQGRHAGHGRRRWRRRTGLRRRPDHRGCRLTTSPPRAFSARAALAATRTNYPTGHHRSCAAYTTNIHTDTWHAWKHLITNNQKPLFSFAFFCLSFLFLDFLFFCFAFFFFFCLFFFLIARCFIGTSSTPRNAYSRPLWGLHSTSNKPKQRSELSPHLLAFGTLWL